MDTKKERILVIDDEKEVRRLLRVTLTAHSFLIEESEDGKSGINKAAFLKPDLILLDLSLPDIDGLAVLKRIREFSLVPIIILSVRESEKDKVLALDSGADDYITKPFSIMELLARIRAAIRHSKKEESDPVIILGDLKIDLATRNVYSSSKEIKLSPIEYDILKLLAQNKEKIVTQKYLLSKVWGDEYKTESHYLRVYIGQIRKKIEKYPGRPQHLITEPGIGYRLI
jgi:two-component system, OmpR family, KDP operon response regulator KdpE